MSDWAQDAAQKTLQQDAIRNQNTEKANRDAKIKAEAGPALFKQLGEWITKQVGEYNRLIPPDEGLSVITSRDNRPQPLASDAIVVSRKDGKKGPLKITFNATTGVIHYECGAGQATFNLKVSDDGTAYFETPYHIAKTIEDIGAEALSKFQDSTF